jgi:hypothetical protein
MNARGTRHERGLLPTFPSVKADTDCQNFRSASQMSDRGQPFFRAYWTRVLIKAWWIGPKRAAWR